MQEARITASQFGRQFVLSALVIAAIVVGLTYVLFAHLRPTAPLLLFVVLACLAKIVCGKVSLGAMSGMGAAVFVGSALADPVWNGAKRLQYLGVVDTVLLTAAGLITGYLGGRLLLQIFEMGRNVHAGSEERVYSVPRRFGTGTILLATTLFAAMFGALNYANARPWELFFYGTFVATVGLFQAVFQRSPRWASLLAGGIFLPLSIMIYGSMGRRWIFPRMRVDPSLSFEAFLVMAACVGLLVGYLGGTLIAGVFLVSDYVVRFFTSWTSHPKRVEDAAEVETVPGSTLSLLAQRAVAARRDAS